MAGYQTTVTLLNQKGISSEELKRKFQPPGDVEWPVTPSQSTEKERTLPLPDDHNENRDQEIGKAEYNKVKRKPMGLPNWRTLSQDGTEYGHPTKFDYNYVRRRHALQVRKPSERQKNMKGDEKVRSDRKYRQNKQRIKRKRRDHYRRKIKNDPDRDRYQRNYRKYPGRYKRRGQSPFSTAAERTNAWREKHEKKAMAERVAMDWIIWKKETRPPPGPQKSQRVPDLTNHPQPGLFTPQREPAKDVFVPMVLEAPSSAKVIPQWSDLENHKKRDKPEGAPNNFFRNERGVKTARRVAARYLAKVW